MAESYRLNHFGFLKVSGTDAVKFMQGYTTCDVPTLDETSVQLGAMCNIQGRMVNSFLVIRQGDDLIFRMDRTLIEKTMAFLGKYIVFSKAELQDISASLFCYGSLTSAITQGVEQHKDGFTVNLGHRCEHWCYAPIPDAAEDPAPYIDQEISDGICWVDGPSSETHLPQLFNYHADGGIDFAKGCYLGQEIVARMHYRGQLKRRLHRLDKRVIEIPDGEVIVAGQTQTLAILANHGDEPFSLTDNDGQVITATPLT